MPTDGVRGALYVVPDDACATGFCLSIRDDPFNLSVFVCLCFVLPCITLCASTRVHLQVPALLATSGHTAAGMDCCADARRRGGDRLPARRRHVLLQEQLFDAPVARALGDRSANLAGRSADILSLSDLQRDHPDGSRTWVCVCEGARDCSIPPQAIAAPPLSPRSAQQPNCALDCICCTSLCLHVIAALLYQNRALTRDDTADSAWLWWQLSVMARSGGYS